MIKYIDKFGKEIKKGDVLLNYRNNGARIGVAREIDNLLYFCCQRYYDSEQGRIPLCEMDLSKLSVFDIPTFNKKKSKQGNYPILRQKRNRNQRRNVSVYR